jgi:hypothetical protein
VRFFRLVPYVLGQRPLLVVVFDTEVDATLDVGSEVDEIMTDGFAYPTGETISARAPRSLIADETEAVPREETAPQPPLSRYSAKVDQATMGLGRRGELLGVAPFPDG